MSYCTVDDLRAEGFDKSDDELTALIKLSCNFIERVTEQFFEPREITLKLDGRGGRVLPLPFILIEPSNVIADNEEVTDYINYQDYKYPKLVRLKKWPQGFQNIEISGIFGYSETPEDIKRAAIKIAMYHFPALNNSEAQEEKNLRGLLVSETTDGHSYSLSGSAVASAYQNAITGDTEIDDILRRYMRTRIRMRAV